MMKAQIILNDKLYSDAINNVESIDLVSCGGGDTQILPGHVDAVFILKENSNFSIKHDGRYTRFKTNSGGNLVVENDTITLMLNDLCPL